ALGSTVLSQRSESYVSLITAVMMLGVGLFMLVSTWRQSSSGAHEHGFGHGHSHPPHVHADARPSWGVLLGLGLAGGLLPDPAALAVLLAAVASGKVVLGLLTVLVFSLGFASVLVMVGAVVGHVGRLALGWFNPAALAWLEVATGVVIVVVGGAMTIGAWRQV